MSALLLTHSIRLTRRWVRLYTAGLPTEVREARRAELESDLWEQEQEAGAAGCRPTTTALHVQRRFMLGIPADLSWRQQQGGSKIIRKAGRGAIEGARLTAAAIRRNWALGTVILALAGAFSAVGLVSQAGGAVDPTNPKTCFLHRTGDEPASKRPATDRKRGASVSRAPKRTQSGERQTRSSNLRGGVQ